jgi:UDPglucose 6-dehydrogenase
MNFDYLADMPIPERVTEINRLRAEIAKHSPFKSEPVDCVMWVPAESVQANDYNPNAVAPPEMELLKVSVLADGYTQPIVTMPDGDIHTVVDAIGRDPRIGREFLQPGPGFGGSCFPKDTIGLVTLAAEAGYKFGLLESVIEANEQQLERVVEKVRRAVGGNLEGKLVAVWGLTFKANTDDRRHSPALTIARKLLLAGARLAVFDPTVDGSVPELEANAGGAVAVAPSAVAACAGADALVVLTEWSMFAGVSPVEVAGAMGNAQVVDARNLLDREAWRAAGFTYQGIGR